MKKNRLEFSCLRIYFRNPAKAPSTTLRMIFNGSHVSTSKRPRVTGQLYARTCIIIYTVKISRKIKSGRVGRVRSKKMPAAIICERNAVETRVPHTFRRWNKKAFQEIAGEFHDDNQMTRQKGWQRENMRHWHREEKRTDFPGCRKIVLANYARDKSVERSTAQGNPEGESSKRKEFERNAIKTNGRTCGASKSFGLRQVFFTGMIEEEAFLHHLRFDT